MTHKKRYRAVNVKDVDLAALTLNLAAPVIWVGIDVGKAYLLVVVCVGPGQFWRPWRVRKTEQAGLLIQLLTSLAQGRKLVIALEPTGTYGDPLRYALSQAKLEVQRVPCKISHDYAEVLDGSPSQLDPKDAAGLAELAMIGKSEPWPWTAEPDRLVMMRQLVWAADEQQRASAQGAGRVEALLARHWPEATQTLQLDSTVLLKALIEYGDPRHLAADPQAAGKLQRWGGTWLEAETIQALLAGAGSTVGVPASALERAHLQRSATAALAASRLGR